MTDVYELPVPDNNTGLVARMFPKLTLIQQFSLVAALALGLTMLLVGVWSSKHVVEHHLQSNADTLAAIVQRGA